MDFNLKQWRNQSEHQESPQKLPKLSSASSALPLFVPEPTTALSAFSSHNTPATKFPRMGSYFSLAQWQELELQALIFRYMISGAAVPHELLLHVKKSLISSPSTPYYICNPLHQYYSQYQPSLLQSGYWGKAAVDPEPGRCRRTDGKKWRCSRDVVAGQKYCERHMHRGRNRSRKPVEIPTSTTGAAAYSGNGGGDTLKTNHSTAQETANDVNGGLSGHLSSSMDLLHFNRRPLDSLSETKYPFESQNDRQTNGDRTLRHFFDDWPKSLQETDNATNLSISMPENLSSDFSLKLGTGNGDEFRAQIASGERERTQPNWSTAWDTNRERTQPNWSTAWDTNRVAPMGGPLAEALRSSTTTSPTSVLHRLSRSSASEASFVSS